MKFIDSGDALLGKHLIVFVRRLFHIVESVRAVVDDRIEFQCALAHEGHCKCVALRALLHISEGVNNIVK